MFEPYLVNYQHLVFELLDTFGYSLTTPLSGLTPLGNILIDTVIETVAYYKNLPGFENITSPQERADVLYRYFLHPNHVVFSAQNTSLFRAVFFIPSELATFDLETISSLVLSSIDLYVLEPLTSSTVIDRIIFEGGYLGDKEEVRLFQYDGTSMCFFYPVSAIDGISYRHGTLELLEPVGSFQPLFWETVYKQFGQLLDASASAPETSYREFPLHIPFDLSDEISDESSSSIKSDSETTFLAGEDYLESLLQSSAFEIPKPRLNVSPIPFGMVYYPDGVELQLNPVLDYKTLSKDPKHRVVPMSIDTEYEALYQSVFRSSADKRLGRDTILINADTISYGMVGPDCSVCVYIAAIRDAVVPVIKILLTIVPLLIAIAYTTLLERKVMAAVQRRSGPNLVGLYGLLQPLADGLKLFLKETIIPSNANMLIFILSPVLTFFLSLITWVVVPFSPSAVLLDMNVGVLYLLAVSSLSVYGIIMAGWSSNSKYAFLGSLRSAAQLISYEISISIILLTVLVCVGSLNLSDIVLAQRSVWFMLPLFPSFVMFVISGLAETNRAPFDLPEAEAELVSGYNVEYSAMSFALFFLGEYAHMILMGSMTTVFFLGGWLPPVDFFIFNIIPSYIWFGLKVLAVLFFFVWVRASFPRYRYDQLMTIGWKTFLPLSFGWFLLVVAIVYCFNESFFVFLPLFPVL